MPGLAQTPVRPAMLAPALAALPPGAIPDGATLLCVGADGISPVPVDPAQIPPSDTDHGPALESQTDEAGVTTVPTDPLGVLVLRYGRSLQTFGHVQALAPPTMTVLNADPNLANLPLADLITQSPLPFLLGTLTPGQWQKLADAGLSLSDLSADQQGLLRAALPLPLKIAPTATAPPSLSAEQIKTWTAADWQKFNAEAQKAQKIRDAQTQTIPDDLIAHTARFRVFLENQFVFDVPGQSGYAVAVRSTPFNGPKPNPFELTDIWKTQQQAGDKLSRCFKASLPNELKDGDLHWNRRELSARIPLNGLRSVDDLVARLARATGLELYADGSYGGQFLSVEGRSDQPQEARDVMQALALCVCGAWRQVGPAYVLTDDGEGLATRKAKIKEVVDIWSDRLRSASDGISNHLHDLRWRQTVPFSPDDKAALPDDLRQRVAGADSENGPDAALAWGDLPPSTQTGVRAGLREYEQETDVSTGGTAGSAARIEAALTPQTSVRASFSLRFALELPGFGDIPLDINSYTPRQTSPSSPIADTPAPPRPVDRVVLTEPRRAVLCAPTTPKQARDVVDQLAALGFNTLFCDVFTDGRAYVPNTALSPPDGEAGGVLAAAIDEGAKRRVAVYAVLDTLCWRRDALDPHPLPLPAGVTEDRTLQDETLAQFVRRQLDEQRFHDPYEHEAVESQGEQRWVSPADPQVHDRLENLVRALAAVPGLAGLAFQETAPPGYLGGGDTGSALDVELGYTIDQRLAYLRARHADPLDIGSWRETGLTLNSGSGLVTIDASIPGFGNMLGSQSSPWDDWRAAQDQALLSNLWAAAHEANPGLPLWMREQRIGFTFDPWADPTKPNKADSLRSEGNALGRRVTGNSILVVLYPGWALRMDKLPDDIRQFRQQFGGGKASGILLDLTADGPDSDPLRTLNRYAPMFEVPPGLQTPPVKSSRL